MRHLCLCLFASLITANALAKLEYTSAQLMMRNSDQVNELVRKKIKRAAELQAKHAESDDVGPNAPGAIDALKDGVRLIFSRPDQDGTRGPAFARLRRELADLGELENVLGEITDEAIAYLKNKSEPAPIHSTYILILENLMGEVKLEIKQNAKFKNLIVRIRDAQIEISDKVKGQQLLRTMSRPVSPSRTAENIVPKGK